MNEKAIALLSDVDKSIYNSKNYYTISPIMFQKINEKIDAKSGNQRTLLLYLIFQQQNGTFSPAETTIITTCNMLHSRYVEARKGLIEKGLITYIPYKSITINYTKLME